VLSGRLRRARAVLGAGDHQIVLDVSGWRPQASAEVSGDWEHRDLLVLACFFAMIARRRRAIALSS
jgi:hypothetical protein